MSYSVGMLARKNTRPIQLGPESNSSFRPRSKQRNRGWMILFIATGIAVLALLAAMIAVTTITAPTL